MSAARDFLWWMRGREWSLCTCPAEGDPFLHCFTLLLSLCCLRGTACPRESFHVQGCTMFPPYPCSLIHCLIPVPGNWSRGGQGGVGKALSHLEQLVPSTHRNHWQGGPFPKPGWDSGDKVRLELPCGRHSRFVLTALVRWAEQRPGGFSEWEPRPLPAVGPAGRTLSVCWSEHRVEALANLSFRAFEEWRLISLQKSTVSKRLSENLQRKQTMCSLRS